MTRVLIVEDEPLVSMLLLDLVEDSGFTAVGSVETPEEALAVATRQQPDIAIIDINLRRARDGIPLGAQLSRLGTSIIFTSGHDDLGNWPEIKSLETGRDSDEALRSVRSGCGPECRGGCAAHSLQEPGLKLP